MNTNDVFKYVNSILGNKEKIVFEIGGYIGDSSNYIIQSLSPIKEYHAFEPDYRNFEILENKLFNFKFAKTNFCAIGSRDGKSLFRLSGGTPPNTNNPDWSAGSSIKVPKLCLKEQQWLNFDRTTEVNIITLDTYCQNNNISNIDFIWADVQGAEEELISGGLNILKHTKFLFTEYSDFERFEGEITKEAILKMLPGWRLVFDLGDDILLINEG